MDLHVDSLLGDRWIDGSDCVERLDHVKLGALFACRLMSLVPCFVGCVLTSWGVEGSLVHLDHRPQVFSLTLCCHHHLLGPCC